VSSVVHQNVDAAEVVGRVLYDRGPLHVIAHVQWQRKGGAGILCGEVGKGIGVRQLLREIRELGYQGSSSLLVRYINQGRAERDRLHLSPRRATRILLTRPENLTAGQAGTLAGLAAACPEMTLLASLITRHRRVSRYHGGRGR
jgi:hypothetical protein